MSARNLILTGVPRGGTTLCCHLLNQATDTVALFEPIPVPDLPVGAAALDYLHDYFARSRARLLADGEADSYRDAAGRIPDNPALDRPGQPRGWQVEHGTLHVDKPLSPGFTLAIKHNASFTALLPALAGAFAVVAIVRHPLAVLASWNSLALPVGDGHAPAAERQDAALAAALAARPDRHDRQLHLLDWFFRRYRDALPAARVLRYEDLVAGDGQPLFAATGVVAPAPLAALTERNANPAYRDQALGALAARLLATDGAWWHWYPRDSVPALLARLTAS